MPRLLVIKPDGSRDVILIGDTGSYYDQAKVVWDERVDGSMPDDVCPSMIKVDGRLVLDDTLVAANTDRQLTDNKAVALVEIDQINDYIVTLAIGRRDTEYLMAEKQAQAYIDAGYTGDTYPYVHSWAIAKGETEQWAADDIIATANTWRTVQSDVREKRLVHKENIRNAATIEEFAVIMQSWYAYVEIVKTQLGI